MFRWLRRCRTPRITVTISAPHDSAEVGRAIVEALRVGDGGPELMRLPAGTVIKTNAESRGLD